MLIGHYAPALVLKRVRPSVPLWVLFIGVQAVDVLWGLFILTGVERARIVPGFTESNALDLYFMPYTHSLAATIVWSVGLAALWIAFAPGVRSADPRARWADGAVVGVAVASHFATDWLVHVHDLPLAGDGGLKLGLGLWRHRTAALIVEGGLFALAAAYHLAGVERRARARYAIFWGVMAVVLVVSFYVPTPPSPAMMAATGLGTYTLLAAAAAYNERTARRPGS